jgi:hypothetical protein
VQQAFSCVETTCRVDELPAFAMTISFLKHESPTVAKDLLLAIFQNPTWGEIRTTLSPVRGVSPVVGQNKALLLPRTNSISDFLLIFCLPVSVCCGKIFL